MMGNLKRAKARKPRILFVGAFQPPANSKIRGGQLAACQAILAGHLSQHVVWVLLDSTMISIPPPPKARRAWSALLRLFQFLRQLAFSHVDVVLIFTASGLSLLEKGLMAILAKLAGKRVVLCPRSGLLIREWRRHNSVRIWLKLVVHFCDAVVCQGQSWREFFVSVTGQQPARFPIIYNIVSTKEVAPLPQREIAERALMMCWIERNKGIFDLVDIAERFRPELAGFKFVICGHGADWTELKLELKKRGLEEMFELPGWADLNAKQNEMEDADMCLMLSHLEGMPNALIEAMASGRPVVATAVGAVPDILAETESGYLCEPRDIEGIGFRILDLRRDRALRMTMGQNGRQKICLLMSDEVVWGKWLAVLCPSGRVPGSETVGGEN